MFGIVFNFICIVGNFHGPMFLSKQVCSYSCVFVVLSTISHDMCSTNERGLNIYV